MQFSRKIQEKLSERLNIYETLGTIGFFQDILKSDGKVKEGELFGYELRFNNLVSNPNSWSLTQKQSYILSLFSVGLILDLAVTLHFEDSVKVYEVLDGKKRLKTVLEFVNNEFPIYVNGSETYFKDLREIFQTSLLNTNFKMLEVGKRRYKPINERDKIILFLDLNYLSSAEDLFFLNELRKRVEEM